MQRRRRPQTNQVNARNRFKRDEYHSGCFSIDKTEGFNTINANQTNIQDYEVNSVKVS